MNYNILIFISLLLVNIICWYFLWKAIFTSNTKFWVLTVSLVVYIITINLIYDVEFTSFIENDVLGYAIKLLLFSVYVFIAYKAYRHRVAGNTISQ